MRKFILGASLALAAAAGHAVAQGLPSQPPAPIIPVQNNGSAATAPSGAAAPVVPMTSDPYLGSRSSGFVEGGPTPGYRMYTEGTFLLMFLDSGNIPIPLATGGPSQGVIGRPGTTVLAGARAVDYDGTTPGFRVAVGGWMGESRMGFEASGMYLGQETDTQVIATGPSGVVARPFLDPATRRENARVIVSPGAFSGNVTVTNQAELWGFELNPFWRLVQGDVVSMDFITGFRFTQWNESLSVNDTSRLLAGGVSAFNGFGLAAPSTLLVRDRIGATSSFYGGNVGSRLSFGRGGMFLDLTGKVALGGVTQNVNVDGVTIVQNGGSFVTPAGTGGGFLASGNAQGNRNTHRFAVIPEGDLKLGYQFTSWMNLYAGYSVLYMSSVARPGDQITRNITLNQLPTSPTYNGRGFGTRATEVFDDGLWIHGFNFGITLMY